jgi:predicted esterase
MYKIEKRLDDRVILHPKEAHKSTFIWLHGIGETAYNYAEKFLNEFMELPPDCKIIIPTAPMRLVTDIEKKTYSWFDITTFHMPDEQEGETMDNEYFSRSFSQKELKQSA